MPATLPTRTTRTDRAVHALRVRVQSLLLDRPSGDGARTVEVLTSDDARLLTRYRAPHSARRWLTRQSPAPTRRQPPSPSGVSRHGPSSVAAGRITPAAPAAPGAPVTTTR